MDPELSRLDVRPTQDAELVNAILRDPDVYRASADDLSPPPDRIDASAALATGRFVAYACFLDDGCAGVFLVEPRSGVLFEVHTAILPRYRGPVAARAAQGLLHVLFTTTPCRTLMTLVPSFNRGALRFSRLAGLERCGVLPRSFLRDGVLHDQTILSIARDDYLGRASTPTAD